MYVCVYLFMYCFIDLVIYVFEFCMYVVRSLFLELCSSLVIRVVVCLVLGFSY